MEFMFNVNLQLRIDWAELDLFGHVNNVAFMKYVQAARVHYWEQVGIYQHFLQTRVGPMLASVTCDYRQPLFYPGNILIESRMNFIKNTSFSLQHHVLNDNGKLVAEAEDVMVMYDFNRNEKILFPENFRRKIEELEGRAFTIA